MEVISATDKLLKLMKNFISIVFLIFLIIFSFYLIDKRSVTVISPFEVSGDISKTLMDGRSIATVILGKIKKIHEIAHSDMDSLVEDYSGNEEHEIEFEGINFSTIIRLVNQLLGKKVTTIKGVVYKNIGNVYVIVSINGVEKIVKFGPPDKINDIFEDVSEDIVASTEPYILARYYTKFEDYDDNKIYNLIYHSLSNSNIDDDHWAINLWGNYYYQKEKYVLAAEKYKEAFESAEKIGIDFYIAVSNYGAALFNIGDVKNARKNLTKAIRINDDYYHPYLILGVIESRDSNYENAIDYLSTALKKDRTIPNIHYQLSRAYWFNSHNAEKSMRHAKISLQLYDEQELVSLRKRGKNWIKQICNEMIEDTSKYIECDKR